VSPCTLPAALGFGICPGRREKDDDREPSIGIGSDGPGQPVPLRPPRPLTAGPGLSARPDGFPLVRLREWVGRRCDGLGSGQIWPVPLFFYENPSVNFLRSVSLQK
jgi:hypothetical protein